MLITRRQIREKVMKTLYAFSQGSHQDLNAAEKELLHSISKVYDLFLYYLLILPELTDFARRYLEERKQKRLPTEDDLHPSLHFVNNQVAAALHESEALKKRAKELKISWDDQPELIKKLYFSFKDQHFFKAYLAQAKPDFEEDRKVAMTIFEEYVFVSDAIQQLFEERSLYWLDEVELIQQHVLRFLMQMKPAQRQQLKIPSLHKVKEEDLEFASSLLHKTVINSDRFQQIIAERTQNWEIDRVARMDMILMKMALTELMEFPTIPVKVTLDEYIEISKDYSSPQSKTFINGILDKLVEEYKREQKILKTGRGLIE